MARKYYRDLSRLDFDSGKRTLVLRNDASMRFLTDDHHRVRHVDPNVA
jgi:hypothetical protein